MKNKGYSLIETGWTTKTLVNNGTKSGVIKSIAKVSGGFNLVILDSNIILEAPQGETFIDRKIMKWILKDCSYKYKILYWLAKLSLIK